MTLTTTATTRVQTVDTRIGKLEFEQGVPTLPTVKNLYDQMDFQRAGQLFLWAMPLVQVGNLEVTLQGTAGAQSGDLGIYLGNEQSVFLTPNATTPYAVGYLNFSNTEPAEL